MRTPVLRFGNFLAPRMLPVYGAIADYIGRSLGCEVRIENGASYDQVHDDFDVCFICGLAYIELANQAEPPIQPIAAPVLQGKRFAGKPIYYSDVVVRRSSSFFSFADLRGRSWCYNEPHSQSGYGITLYWLTQNGESSSYFAKVVQAGWHERSIQLVVAGEIDASAVDAQVLALALRDRPELRSQLRVIASLGPSTIQPVTAGRHLPANVKNRLQQLYLQMHRDPQMKRRLAKGLIDRFIEVDDGSYNDLRAMRSACAAADCLSLR